MSRTIHGSKGPGYEYWASRWRRYGEQPGRFTKTKTHRFERRHGKEDIRRTPEEAIKRLAF
jgi:hypothetical protein